MRQMLALVTAFGIASTVCFLSGHTLTGAGFLIAEAVVLLLMWGESR